MRASVLLRDLVRTRFAPSPTGYLHLGGLRTALFNYLYAKKHGGQFILRVEDTDRKRFVASALPSLLSNLEWLGLIPDEGPESGGDFGPYIQSQRLPIYRKHLASLIAGDLAYPCFCDAERLEQVRLATAKSQQAVVYDSHCRHLPKSQTDEMIAQEKPHVYRFKNTPELSTQPVLDLTYGHIAYKKPVLRTINDDFILMKTDGFPTYHLANVVDDHEMQISHVLRGEEWLPSLPKHVALYTAFNWKQPQFGHMPLIMTQDGQKMSKRRNDLQIDTYRVRPFRSQIAKLKEQNNGWEPEAVCNAAALLGAAWQNIKGDGHAKQKVPNMVMSMNVLVERFELANINRKRAIPFEGTLEFLNRKHVAKKVADPQQLHQLAVDLRPLLKEAYSDLGEDSRLDDLDYLAKVIQVLHTYCDKVSDITGLVETQTFFRKPNWKTSGSQKMLEDIYPEDYARIVETAYQTIDSMAELPKTPDEIQKVVIDIGDQTKLYGKKLMKTLRHALTAKKAGPSVAEIIMVLGKEQALARLKSATNQKYLAEHYAKTEVIPGPSNIFR